MKAILVTQFGGPETMAYRDVDIPRIGAGQVLIRVETTSVNFADIKSRYGKKIKGSRERERSKPTPIAASSCIIQPLPITHIMV